MNYVVLYFGGAIMVIIGLFLKEPSFAAIGLCLLWIGTASI